MKDRKAGLFVHRRGWLLLLGVGLMILFCLFLFRSQTRGGHVERSNRGETMTNIPEQELDLLTKVRKGHGLLIANPMVGRPTPDTVTLTAKANTTPVSLMLRLCKESQQKSICESDVLPIEFITWRPSTVVQYGLAVQARVEEKGADGSGRVLNLKKREYVEMTLLGLEPGTSYNWFLLVREITPFRLDVMRQEVFSGRFTTQRTSSASSFTFDIFADPHLFSEQFSEQFKNHPERDKMLETFHAQKAQVEAEFLEVAKHINADKPDFIVGLGDPFDLHGLGFTPALSKEEAVLAHAHARRFFSVFNESGALFQVVGNWEGESGCHPADARQNAILARQIFQINPRPYTYHWHGSADEDYYAFSWGDMLAVVLNVLGYDETCHQMGQVFGSKKYGNYKSFTLGEQQQKFVEKTLTESKHAYKVVFIHHALAGRAKDPVNADYGRGGYLAAKTGGQRWLHDLMVETGVQIMFYGHDHVFTDGVVDNVHYTLPGTISAPWKFTSEETGYTKFNATSGHARVHVSPQDMTVEFVSIENKVIHSYQVKPGKHTTPASAAI